MVPGCSQRVSIFIYPSIDYKYISYNTRKSFKWWISQRRGWQKQVFWCNSRIKFVRATFTGYILPYLPWDIFLTSQVEWSVGIYKKCCLCAECREIQQHTCFNMLEKTRHILAQDSHARLMAVIFFLPPDFALCLRIALHSAHCSCL